MTTTPSIFVRNCAVAAAGHALGISPRGYDIAAVLGQGDASLIFLSIGETVERKSGGRRAEDAMDALATVAGMIGIATATNLNPRMTVEKSADLLAFCADRMRHMDWEGRA